MAKKYKRGKQIKSVCEFEHSKSRFFIVLYGNKEKTTQRGWIVSWQYSYLYFAIKAGRIFEANLIDQCKGCVFNNDPVTGCSISELAYATMNYDGKCNERMVFKGGEKIRPIIKCETYMGSRRGQIPDKSSAGNG